MNILVVLESFHPNIGGVETLFKGICEGLVRNGYSISLVTTRVNGHPPLERINGVDVRRVGVRSRYLFTLMGLFPLFSLASRHDLILTTTYNAALPAWIAAVCRRKKIVIVIHEVWGGLWFRLPFWGFVRKFGHYLFEQAVIRLPYTRIVAVSNATAQRLIGQGAPASRIVTIYNGIDYTALDGHRHEPSGPFTCVYFGRIGLSKGLNLLLEAAYRFVRAHPESRFRLILPDTPGKLSNWIRDFVRTRDLSRYVLILHHLPAHELMRELTSAHCVAIPSYSEGFCFAAVEAAGLGVPIISSGLGALPEVVSGRFVVMKAQTPEALCEALERARRGDWDRNAPRRFPIEETVSGYHRLFTEMKMTDPGAVD
jgi:glycosyltransferase involved in cell wall biosynthesis